ncbi:helix-turn-helix transcriptional regulator [Desulfitobacterium metallireducens]|uniref:Uncharacterized protein n=1 Tax=Desulfitobacterium metallireducens DSM 15288 TaxID=871968 RepID=W0EBG2_9FIRM|nr:WYL domain-containing protein [Desulfitobacterium metallireducens]AHF06406.1 hypothetical protein DESME_04535 [Desulfitobacterium metallireducens DSM 15288]
MTSVERVEKIIALLRAHSVQGISVIDLAKACAVPLATIQHDLEMMLNSFEVQLPIFTDQDEQDDEERGDYEEDLFEPHVKWYLLQSDSHKSLFHINIGEALALVDTLNLLATESSEKETLKQKLLAPFDFEQEGNYRLIKGNLTPLELIAPELFLSLENSILQKKKIQFKYGEKMVIVEPLGLVYYSRLRCWYLVARHDEIVKSYHFHKIEDILKLNEGFELPEHFKLKAWLAPHWGMEFGKPMDVKVRFYERSHTLDKLKKDVAHRPSCILSQEQANTWVMEDQIIGENEFITWLLGFGSAAEVLEPQELRGKMRERVSQALSRYLQE